MNNPLRAAIQRHFEARRLLGLGGRIDGGHALEIGCGRGVGTEIILRQFGAVSVDAFDLDPRMVAKAEKRLARYGSRVRVFVDDAAAIGAPDDTYDAVFVFGIIHHVPDWRRAVLEIHRVLKPGGQLYAEEIQRAFILNPISRTLFDHPLEDRFDADAFLDELTRVGFEITGTRQLGSLMVWAVGRKQVRNGALDRRR